MNATAQRYDDRYQDDLAFWTLLRGALSDFVTDHEDAQCRARRELGFPSAEPRVDRRRQPYDLPASPLRIRPVHRRDWHTAESEVALVARFRAEATLLARRDPDVAAIVSAFEEGGEDGPDPDPDMIAVIANLDPSRYATAMLTLAELMDAISEEWTGY